jgi:hypothetical protein
MTLSETLETRSTASNGLLFGCAGCAAFEVVAYAPHHLRGLALQPMQAELGAFIADGDYAEKVALAGPAWSALDGGRSIACAGFTFPWEGRAVAWAVLGDCGARMLRVTRAVRAALARCPSERIECQVKADFAPGLRWAETLGFAREAFMPRFCRGEDFWSYVILKGGHRSW